MFRRSGVLVLQQRHGALNAEAQSRGVAGRTRGGNVLGGGTLAARGSGGPGEACDQPRPGQTPARARPLRRAWLMRERSRPS